MAGSTTYIDDELRGFLPPEEVDDLTLVRVFDRVTGKHRPTLAKRLSNVSFKPEVTGLIGGTDSDLDAQTGAEDQLVVVRLTGSDELEWYQIETSSDATSSPDVIRTSNWSTSGLVFRRVTQGLPDTIEVDAVQLSDTDGLILPNRSLGYSDTEDRPVIHDGATTGGLPLALKNENGIHVVGQASVDLADFASDTAEIPLGTVVIPGGLMDPSLYVGMQGAIRSVMQQTPNLTGVNFYVKIQGAAVGNSAQWPARDILYQHQEWVHAGYLHVADTPTGIFIVPGSTGTPGGACIASAMSNDPAHFTRAASAGVLNTPDGEDATVDQTLEIGILLEASANLTGNFAASADLRFILP